MQFETTRIDKDIPIPLAGSRNGRDVKYPLRQLEIGDSFAIEGSGREVSGRLSAHIAHVSKKTGFKFTRRSVIEDGVKKIRIWRFA